VADTRLTCHRCGSASLVLTEVCAEVHTWADGLRLVDGRIEPVGEATAESGDLLTHLTRIRCEACGHTWRPRRSVGMPHEEES
jgi:hypothetical protein